MQLTQELRQRVLEGIVSERLASGWDLPPELLDVYASPLGDTHDGLAVALTATPATPVETWLGRHPIAVLQTLVEEPALTVAIRRGQGIREHGKYLGVLFQAETAEPEMLNATFAGPAGEWAHLGVERVPSSACVPPILYSEYATQCGGITGAGGLLDLLLAIARSAVG